MFEGRVCNWSAAGIEQAMKEAPSSRCCPGIPLLPRKALREAEARSTGRGGAGRSEAPPPGAPVCVAAGAAESHSTVRSLKTRQRGSPRRKYRRPQRPARTARSLRRARHCALAPVLRPYAHAAPRQSPRPQRSSQPASDSAPAPDVPPRAAPPAHPARPAAPPGCRGPGAARRACTTLAAAGFSSAAAACRHGRVPPAPAGVAPRVVSRGLRPRVALRQVRGTEAAEGGPAGDCGWLGSDDASKLGVWPGMASTRGWFFLKRLSEERFPRNRVLCGASHNGCLVKDPQRGHLTL